MGAEHDPRLIQWVQESARQQGLPLNVTVNPLGATDASAFSVAGIPATCIICQDTSRLVPNYHTRLDTIERVRPTSLAVCLQAAWDVLEAMDHSVR